MIVQQLDMKKDSFLLLEKDENLLGPEVSYLSAIGALIYILLIVLFKYCFSYQFISYVSSTPT